MGTRNTKYSRKYIDYSPHHALTEYRRLPKHFAEPGQSDRLMEIAHELIDEKPYASYMYAAGWAIAESALIDTQKDRDSRHARVNLAKECWDRSKETYLQSHKEKGWSTSKLYTFPDRVQASMIYLPLMHDMINGCVQQDTVDTLHRRLVQLIDISLNAYLQLGRSGDKGAQATRYGHLLELAGAGAVTVLRSPTLTMLPSMERCDDGTYNNQKTHDLMLLHMKWGQIKGVEPIEVKPRGGYGMGSREVAVIRGNSHLKTTGSMNVFPFLAALIDEQKGSASDSQLEELMKVAENIIHEVVDYKSNRFEVT